MKAVGNLNYIYQNGQTASFSTALIDTEMIFPLAPNQVAEGYLFFNYYISGGGGLVGQITPDIAMANYRVAAFVAPSSFGPIGPFTQLGPTALQAWWVHFWMLNDALPNIIRVQIAQQTLDAANPTVLLQGSGLFYSLHY